MLKSGRYGTRIPSEREYRIIELVALGLKNREVADAIPACEYVEIPDCGHAGPLEKPDEVNRELLAFFAKH